MGDSAPASAAADLASVGLAGDFDGIGIKNDEVNGAEFLTLTFDREVKITGVFFLDLYISRKDATDFETAGMDNGSTTLNFDAQEVFSNDALGGGFGNFATSMKGQTFTFFDVAGNDNIGEGDFALAGLTITSVPLPAGVLLLGTALGGLGLTRRRKAIVKA